MTRASHELITPTPKEVTVGQGDVSIPISEIRLHLQMKMGSLAESAVRLIEEAFQSQLLRGESAGSSLVIELASEAPSSDTLQAPPHAEGYALQVTDAGIHIIGRDSAGCYYAAQTLAQLVAVQDGRVTCPRLTIVDWPDYAHRGLLVEDFWTTDRMGVDDYRSLLDRCAALKLNTMAIGIFGGWEIKHHGKLTEFLMVPLHKHPELRTPQLVRYVDPVSRERVELNYLPRMFEEDYLPRVIEMAQERHIKIIPLWGGPAHVTLIPRLHPEISARNVSGEITRYGYCMSEPATWDLLYDILDEIAEKYLLPYGLDTMQLACDEIYPIRSVYEDDPLAEVDPWCRCPKCAAHSEAELLTTYVVRLAMHLKQKGIKTFIWQDTFERLDAMDVLWQGLQAAGLEQDVTMGWWAYKEPLPDLSRRLPITNWVQPSTGILASIFYQDFTRNIYGMLRRGWEAGAVGATAYNSPDPAQHKNHHCLAEFAWNQSQPESIAHFRIKYARRHFGAAWRDALEAYDVAERVFGSYPVIVYMLDQLIYYFNSYPFGVRDYPANVLAAIATDPLALREALKQSVAHLVTAKQLFEQCRRDATGDLVPLFGHECDRVISVVELVLGIVDALAGYTEARTHMAAEPEKAESLLGEGLDRVEAALEYVLSVMRDMSALKPAYLLPAAWQELSYLVAFAGDLLADLERILGQLQGRQITHLPSLPIVERIGEGKLKAAWHPWEF